jgi:hypothetical protein
MRGREDGRERREGAMEGGREGLESGVGIRGRHQRAESSRESLFLVLGFSFRLTLQAVQ